MYPSNQEEPRLELNEEREKVFTKVALYLVNYVLLLLLLPILNCIWIWLDDIIRVVVRDKCRG